MANVRPKSLKFACACGKRLAVPQDWSGRRVRCPKCKAPIVVPVASAAPQSEIDDLFPELPAGDTFRLAPDDSRPVVAPPPPTAEAADGKTCPSCKKTWPRTARICVACGINLKTGRAIEMKDDAHVDHAYVYAENVLWLLSWPTIFGFFPIASEAFGLRKPWAVRGIALLTVLITGWFWYTYESAAESSPGLTNLMMWSGDAQKRDALFEETRTELRDDGVPDEMIDAVVAELKAQPVGEFHWYQPLTSAFLHGDFFHILFNLVFLFVLGSRVNMLIGNTLTLLLYPALAYASAFTQHFASSDEPLLPCIGASGAVSGMAGVYLVLLPASTVHLAVWLRPWVIFIFRLFLGIFPIRGFWVVALFIAFDALFLYLNWDAGVAHWAHLGGAFAGILIGLLLLLTRLVDARGGDLLSVTLGQFAWKLIGPPSAKRRVLW